jgi:hypothetical protein
MCLSIRRSDEVSGMKRSVKMIGIGAAGSALLLVGAAGLVLPVIPGIPLLFLGLVVLSIEFVWARRLLSKLKHRFPKAAWLLKYAPEA